MRKDVRKPRRSILYVPGSNEKALKKSSTLDVDALIYDLEAVSYTHLTLPTKLAV